MDNYQIFISYRRDGGDILAGRIADRFRLLGYRVFFDVESMRSGAFNTQILKAIEKCDDVLVVLPPHALDRCENENDWVRKELSFAFQLEKNIIPIMMRGFQFPLILPEDIDNIRYMQGVVPSNEYFDAVISKIESLLVSNKTSPKKEVDDIITEWKKKTNSIDLNLFWNVSRDLYEEAAFFVDSNGLLYFKGVFSGHSILEIIKIKVYSNKSEEDNRRIIISFSNGDNVIVGSQNYSDFMCLENSVSNKKIFLTSEEEILELWKKNKSSKSNNRSMFFSEDDVLYAWKYCAFSADMANHEKDLYFDNGHVVLLDKKTEYSFDNVIAIKYYNTVHNQDPDDYVRGIKVLFDDKKVELYEDPYIGFKVDIIPLKYSIERFYI